MDVPFSVQWLATSAALAAKYPNVLVRTPPCLCGSCTLPPPGKLTKCQTDALAAVKAARSTNGGKAPVCPGCARCEPAANRTPRRLTLDRLRAVEERALNAWWNGCTPAERERGLFIATETRHAIANAEREQGRERAERADFSFVKPIMGR